MSVQTQTEIRAVTREDAASIGQIYCAAWKETYRGLLPQDYLDSLSSERWKKQYAVSPPTALALWEDGKLVGVVSYHQGRQEKLSDWGEVGSLYLLPCCWKKGYGSRLLREALSRLSQMGYKQVYLWVLQGNRRAIDFYEREGFSFSGDRLETYIGGQRVTELRYIRN